ncbi:Protein of unknown function [Nakamurella panacisegetis]|uniref:DUF1593 domain-containing protein n=1 Tax=Nakamurella panacisegetis TaxID=1090615 RepID=A0A1H0NFH6_9ACTN|nr:DUF1593 domain-containing protein [Nakamurella panacisegetis]SDO91423.1 Protein of unknown function [Nakamurella panacisegetis]
MRSTLKFRDRGGIGLKLSAALLLATTTIGLGVGADASASAPRSPHSETASITPAGHSESKKPRTVVTTDMEQDDLASLIRYLFYTNDLDTEGIIYTSSRYHFAGDGKGTPFFLPGREYTTPQTSWRWTGTSTIQNDVLTAYAKVYPNLKKQDPDYPAPSGLLSRVKVGNIDFEGEMDHDTAGSDLIKKLLLDNDPRPLYLQAWGGTNTIARALQSISEQYSKSPRWADIKAKVTHKAVILASGFQDETYANYISVKWPLLKVEQLSAGYSTWGYNCNRGAGNLRGLPDDGKYFQGAWIKANIQVGPLGSLYRSWLDGQSMPGDPLDIFGDPVAAKTGWCPPQNKYDFLSEGDNVAYLPLLNTGIEDPADPLLGSWGGRATQTTTSPNLWTMVPTELGADGTAVKNYTTARWQAAVQNDFAARVQWSLTPRYRDANHAPRVTIAAGPTINVVAGQTLALRGSTSDPDRDRVAVKWWQYAEEGTYAGSVTFSRGTSSSTTVTVPADARPGQTISVILQGTDNGEFPLTRYARVTLQVV